MAQWTCLQERLADIRKSVYDIVVNKAIDPNELASMSNETIDDMLELNRKLNTKGYPEDERIRGAFIEYYLSLDCIPDEKKLDMFMSRSSVHKLGAYVDINNHKKYVISAIPKLDSCQQIINSLVEGTLEFDFADLQELGASFAKKLARNLRVKTSTNREKQDKRSSISSDDDFGDNGNIKVSRMERLVVNCLTLFHEHLDADEIYNLFKMYVYASDSRLKHFPLGFTRLEGELISGISEHYNLAHPHISPLIGTRRNIEVVFNNALYKHYTYKGFKDFVSKYGSIAVSSIAIEFPYMCYAYVHRVEIDYVKVFPKEGAPALALDNRGNEYVLSNPLNHIQDTEPLFTSSHVETVVVENADSYPAVYVVARNGNTWETKMMWVKDIRVYGTAVSFV